MDQRDFAQQNPEAIRHQIDETRSSITEKLEALEEQVVDTVQNARESVEETIQTAKHTVEETIDTVKSSMHETVQSVKRTVDLKYQVERHPWPMMGVSLLAGATAAVIYDNLRNRPRELDVRYQEPARETIRPAATEPRRHAWTEFFRDEIDKAQGIAVGYLSALARDWAKQNFPDLAPQIHDFMHGFAEKLGGTPIEHEVLHDAYGEASRREESPFSRH